MDRYAQTIQQANNIQAPASPLGNFPELAAATRSTFQLPQSQAGAGGIAAQGQINQAAAAQSAAASIQANNEKIKSLQAIADPKNYQVVSKPDGGLDYRYSDPVTGAVHPVNLQQYSQVTGQTPDKILSQSNNTLDKQFVNDFNHLQDLTNALASNDQNALQNIAVKVYGDNSKSKTDQINKDAIARAEQLKQLKPDDLIKAFTAYYPNVYSNLPWNQYGQGTAQVYGNRSPGPKSPGPGLGPAILGY